MKTDKQKELAKFLADYIEHEREAGGALQYGACTFHLIMDAIDSFESQNNCTIEILE